MSDTYLVTSLKPKVWEITKFSDYKEPDSIYQVSERAGNYHCNCPGFHNQKDKSEHKHIQIVKFWRENLQLEDGFSFWFENNDIEYFKFIPAM